MKSASTADIKELYDRRARAMTRRPDFGRATGHACIHMQDGFACDVHHRDQAQRVDQPESEGGTGTGPQPGELMRASLGACMAMGYRIWGARLGTPIEAVDIEIVCEFDVRGQLDVDSAVPVGWQRILFHVVVVSGAPEGEIRHIVETADRLCPMLANLSPAVARTHRLTILTPRQTPTPGRTNRSLVHHA